MKYCSKCGNELLDDAVICPKCGCAVEGMRNPEAVDNRSGLQTAAKIFMIIGCIAIGWCLIPLAWCIASGNRKIFLRNLPPISGIFVFSDIKVALRISVL